MAEAGPLIDRDALLDVIDGELYRKSWKAPVHVPVADAVLAYLREVLTPGALRTWEEVPGQIPPEPGGDDCGPAICWVTGSDLYRRIFGEDAEDAPQQDDGR
jgi:hypothetical protein